jgi:hypothetical protein
MKFPFIEVTVSLHKLLRRMAVTDQQGCSLRCQPKSFSFGDILHVIFVILNFDQSVSPSFCVSVGRPIDRFPPEADSRTHTYACATERTVEEQGVDSRFWAQRCVVCCAPVSIIHQQISHLS